MTEFTKGTWEAGIDTSSMLPYIWTKLKNIPAKIAVMHRCPYIKDKEQLANARLIAAAPEMYEMITRLVDGITMAELLNGMQVVKVNPVLIESAKRLLSRIDGEVDNINVKNKS